MGYEVNASALDTSSREFPIVRDALLHRYDRFFDEHVPDGRLLRERDATEQQAIAGSYTRIITNHTQTVAGAFKSELYASGFALLRPTVEALLKQGMLADYQGDGDGWKEIPKKPLRITRAHLRQMEERSGCSDILPWWSEIKPLLNDFVHGGIGQLAGNPIDNKGHTRYPCAWFWVAMLITTMCMLVTSGWFWAHIGREERAERVLNAIAEENWRTITQVRNGLPVRIIGR